MPALIVTAVAWGSSFLFIAVALRSFTPTQVAFGRVATGALVLLVMVAVTRGWSRMGWRRIGAIGLVGFCLSGLPMVLIPMAQQEITSILASLLNAYAVVSALASDDGRERAVKLIESGVTAARDASSSVCAAFACVICSRLLTPIVA